MTPQQTDRELCQSFDRELVHSNGKQHTPRSFLCTDCSAIIVALLGVGVALAAGNIDATNKWAWGANVGWVNFDPDHGGVTVYDDHLEGDAWGENIGWIRLGTCSRRQPLHPRQHQPPPTTASTTTVRAISPATPGAANTGWINFARQRRRDDRARHGRLRPGYAWGENVGLDQLPGSSPVYKVRRESRTPRHSGAPPGIWAPARSSRAATLLPMGRCSSQVVVGAQRQCGTV